MGELRIGNSKLGRRSYGFGKRRKKYVVVLPWMFEATKVYRELRQGENIDTY